MNTSVGAELDRAQPDGVWRRATLRGVEIGATIRHLPTAAFFLVFALIWNGVTWFMLYAVLTQLLLPAAGGPAGGPVGGQGGGQSGNQVGGVVFGIVMLVFLTPFVLIGLGAAGAIALSLFGSLRVFVEPSEVRVSIGVGPVRRTRRFDPARAVGIGEGESDVEVDNRARTDIVVDLVGGGGGNGESGSEFRFGASLRGPRRVWVREALRGELVLDSGRV